MSKLIWYHEYDDNDRNVWEAASPYTDDGSPLYFRILQVAGNGYSKRTPRFVLRHDAELQTEGDKRVAFGLLWQAQEYCQRENDAILKAEALDVAVPR